MKKITGYILKCGSCKNLWRTRTSKIPVICSKCRNRLLTASGANVDVKATLYSDGSHSYTPHASQPIPLGQKRNTRPVKLTKEGRIRTYFGISLKREIFSQEDFIRSICGREKKTTEKE